MFAQAVPLRFVKDERTRNIQRHEDVESQKGEGGTQGGERRRRREKGDA